MPAGLHHVDGYASVPGHLRVTRPRSDSARYGGGEASRGGPVLACAPIGPPVSVESPARPWIRRKTCATLVRVIAVAVVVRDGRVG